MVITFSELSKSYWSWELQNYPKKTIISTICKNQIPNHPHKMINIILSCSLKKHKAHFSFFKKTLPSKPHQVFFFTSVHSDYIIFFTKPFSITMHFWSAYKLFSYNSTFTHEITWIMMVYFCCWSHMVDFYDRILWWSQFIFHDLLYFTYFFFLFSVVFFHLFLMQYVK